MSIPCTNSFNPDLTVVESSLPGSVPSALGESAAHPGEPSASFDYVLSNLDEDSQDNSGESPVPIIANAPLTVEQLALIAAMMAPPMAMPPPAVPAPLSPSSLGSPGSMDSDQGSGLTLVGGETRTLPELLASGAEVLEYRCALPSAYISTPATATAPTSTLSAPPIQGGNSVTTQAVASLLPQEPRSAPAIPAAPEKTASVPLPSGAVQSTGSSAVALPVPAQPDLPKSAANIPSTPVAGFPLGSFPLPSDVSTGSTPQIQSIAETRLLAATPGINLVPTVDVQAAPTAIAASTFSVPSPASSGRVEKAAGLLRPGTASGDKALTRVDKNVRLITDIEQFSERTEEVGTVAANWGETVYQIPNSFPQAPSLESPSPVISAHGPAGGVVTAEADKTASSRAAGLVHEIHAIADGLWAVERNTVEVKFNFGEQERLSVRVEYRDGTVQATFQTDSPTLRDAIARDWQSRSVTPEQRPYRMADPIFSGGQSGSSLGGDASRHQRSSEQQPQPMPFERFTTGPAPRSGSGMTTSLANPPVSRPAARGHLHALV